MKTPVSFSVPPGAKTVHLSSGRFDFVLCLPEGKQFPELYRRSKSGGAWKLKLTKIDYNEARLMGFSKDALALLDTSLFSDVPAADPKPEPAAPEPIPAKYCLMAEDGRFATMNGSEPGLTDVKALRYTWEELEGGISSVRRCEAWVNAVGVNLTVCFLIPADPALPLVPGGKPMRLLRASIATKSWKNRYGNAGPVQHFTIGDCPLCGRRCSVRSINKTGATCRFDGSQFNDEGTLLYSAAHRYPVPNIVIRPDAWTILDAVTIIRRLCSFVPLPEESFVYAAAYASIRGLEKLVPLRS